MQNDSHDAVEGCWAAPLGNCGGGISHEHLVSECLFKDQSVFVQGLDWCLNKPKQVRIEKLTGKILCKNHNTALCKLDAAAGLGFEAIRNAVKMNEDRAKMLYINWAHQQFIIDGRNLERWFLKTLLNFSFNRKLIIGPGNHSAGTVPEKLVRIAFGLDNFEEGAGLYTAFRPRETFILEDRFRFTAKAQGPNLVVGGFIFRGFRFFLNLLPQRLEMIEGSNLFYRRANFAWLIGNRESHRIIIDWSASKIHPYVRRHGA
jgi:hypothetical protein